MAYRPTKPEDLEEGHYWIRVHHHPEMSSTWQTAYTIRYQNLRAIWLTCGSNELWEHSDDVEVGPRLTPPYPITKQTDLGALANPNPTYVEPRNPFRDPSPYTSPNEAAYYEDHSED